MNRRIVLLGLGCSLAGCAHGAATDVLRDEAAAERAYAAGRYDEAAARWADAASRAHRPFDRDEALYREAATLRRAGNLEAALEVLDRLVRMSPAGTRAPRAAYDRALVLFDLGREAEGYAALDEYVHGRPGSALAPPALGRLVENLVGTRGEDSARAYLEALAPRTAGTALDEYVGYAVAASFERQGDLGRARDRYLDVAARHPYPQGLLWDDALFHAARLDEALGDPRAAVLTLERMLARRETAYFNGSYERGRYTDAAMRIAELYRDQLGDRTRARAAFERVFVEHVTSRRRGEAAWNAALLAKASGDEPGACRDLEALVAALPDSRYAACANTVCPSLEPPRAAGICHDYVVRGIP